MSEESSNTQGATGAEKYLVSEGRIARRVTTKEGTTLLFFDMTKSAVRVFCHKL